MPKSLGRPTQSWIILNPDVLSRNSTTIRLGMPADNSARSSGDPKVPGPALIPMQSGSGIPGRRDKHTFNRKELEGTTKADRSRLGEPRVRSHAAGLSANRDSASTATIAPVESEMMG